MKSKVAILLLILGSVALGIALMVRHQKAEVQHHEDLTKIGSLETNLVQVKTDLGEQKAVNKQLEIHLQKTNEILTATQTTLAKTETDAKSAAAAAAQRFATLKADAEAAAKRAIEDIAKRDAQIAALELDQTKLTKEIGDLNGSIQKLDGLIAKTQQELEVTKGDKAFLLKELKRLQVEKAELERQMNDLAFLKEQVRELKEQLSISKRIDWIRRGLYGDVKKGGQLMMQGFTKPAERTNQFDLKVDITTKGDVKVTPAPTNAPAPKP